MTKLERAAKLLNEKSVAAPSAGRSIKVEAAKLGFYHLAKVDMGRDYEPNVIKVFNVTPRGRIGKTIGFLRLDKQGRWA